MALKGRAVSDAALVALLGAGCLAASAGFAFRPLCWSDELVYAVMGRNIAAGRGLVSNYYDARAILSAGYPLADVHMPGHALALAIGFRLFGEHEWAPIAVNQGAFVATGVLLYAMGRHAKGRAAGALAAVLFYASPPAATFANTAMSEPTLTALTVAYAALWQRALAAPRAVSLAGLLVVCALACLSRETSLILLLPTAYAIARWPAAGRARAGLAAASFLAAFFALVFLPLWAGRAPYPHVLAELEAATGLPQLAELVFQKARTNAARFRIPGSSSWQWTLSVEVLTALLALWLARGLAGPARRTAALAGFLMLGTLAVLAGLNPLWAWNGVRAAMPLAPVGLVPIAVALVGVARPWLRWGLAAAWLSCSGWVAFQADVAVAALLRAALEDGRWRSGLIAAGAAPGERPRLVVARSAFRYGWDAYPASVVWDWPDDAALLALLRRVEVDVVLLTEPAQRPGRRRALGELGFARVAISEGAELYRRARR